MYTPHRGGVLGIDNKNANKNKSAGRCITWSLFPYGHNKPVGVLSHFCYCNCYFRVFASVFAGAKFHIFPLTAKLSTENRSNLTFVKQNRPFLLSCRST